MNFELLERINSLLVVLDATKYSQVSLDKDSISVVCKATEKTQCLKLPVAVSPKSARITTSGASLEIQVEAASEFLPGLKQEHALQPQSEIPTQMSCCVCGNLLLNNTTFSQILDLPSAHWHEMLDCWACHHEDYTKLPGNLVRNSGQIGGQILSKLDILMEAHTYWLIDPQNYNLHTSFLNYTGNEVI